MTTKNKPWRPAKFQTPEALWKAWCEYVRWTNDNPIIEIDFRGKDADRIELPHKRPLTIHGFQRHIGAGVNWFHDFKNSKQYKSIKDFSLVITRMENEMRSDKFDGAATGMYVATIIARDLGLSENVNITAEAEDIVKLYPFAKPQDAD